MIALTEQPTAYYDESWTPGKAFAIAGYVASLENWKRLEERWDEVLRDEQITEFKMNQCQRGEGEFKGWSDERKRQVQDRLIGIIVSSGLTGVVSGTDLRAYDKFTSQIRALVHQRAWKPYTVLFQHQIEKTVEAVQHLPGYERVSFVFDRQTEHESNALAVYNSLKDSGGPESRRMGAIAFDDSQAHPGLQAADVLVFEFRRWLMEEVYRNWPRIDRRWQMLALNRGRLVGGFFNEGALHRFVDVLTQQKMLVTGDFDTEGRRKPPKRRRLR